MNIATFLGDLRHQHGWTFRKVAELAGVSASTICQLESGQIAPTPKTLRKLARAYGVDYQMLMAEAGYLPAVESQASSIVFEGAEKLSREQRRLIQGVINEMVERNKRGTK